MDHIDRNRRNIEGNRFSVDSQYRTTQCVLGGTTRGCPGWRGAQRHYWDACFNTNGSRRTDIPGSECDCMFTLENAIRASLKGANVTIPPSGSNLLDVTSWNGGDTAVAAIQSAVDSVVCSTPQCQASASSTCVQPDVVQLRHREPSACYRVSSCTLRLGSGASTVGLSDDACAMAARGCGWSGVSSCAQLEAVSSRPSPCESSSEQNVPSSGILKSDSSSCIDVYVIILLIFIVIMFIMFIMFIMIIIRRYYHKR